MAHGATNIHGSLAFHGFNAKVTIHHQIWKHAFQIHRKIIDITGYVANIQTQIHTNTHPIYEILLEYSVLSAKIHKNNCNPKANMLYNKTHWINVSVESSHKFHIEKIAAAQQKSITIWEKLREERIEIYFDFESIIKSWLNIYLGYLIA